MALSGRAYRLDMGIALMHQANLRRGLAVASAVAAAMVLASCETPEPPAPPPPPPPPALALNSGVAEAASIYVAFMRDARQLTPNFTDAEAIQALMRRGSAYEATQLSRGMVAYGSILALQSPEFVAGVQSFAADPAQRETMIRQIISDPAYAAQLPGAAQAAGIIIATLNDDVAALTTIAGAVEEDAYTIQGRQDPRRRWATVHIVERDARLNAIKAISAQTMLPSAEDSARLLAAAHDGTSLNLTAANQGPPYTPAVAQSLAIAALAALGAGGDAYVANTEALVTNQNSEFCFTMSKLNLYQCLSASRPHYEDIFCAGRHVVRDLATCTAAAITPAAVPLPTSALAEAPIAADAAAASSNAVQTSQPQPN